MICAKKTFYACPTGHAPVNPFIGCDFLKNPSGKASENDLGRDRIGRLLLRLALPSILAQLINALYNIIDRMFIGRIPDIGATALTGVGVTFPIVMIISAFSALVGMGGAPRAAIKMGEGKEEEAAGILGNCFALLLGVSALLTAVFLLFRDPLLLSFGASADTLPYASDYLLIYVSGTVFVQIALGLNPFINAQGFATTGMTTVLIGAGLNILLDPLFIFGFGMGVRGAAVATILSQAVSAGWVLLFLAGKRTRLRIRLQNMRPRSRVLLPVLALGLSPFIMQSTESLVNIALNASLQRYGGDTAVGAMTICGSVLQVMLMPVTGLTQGASPIISYNYGAQNVERVKKTFRLLFFWSVFLSTAAWLSLMLFPGMYVSIFSEDPALTAKAVWALRIFTGCLFMLGIQFSCQQTFVALGQARTSLLLALLRKIFLLIPLIFLLPCLLSDKVFAVFLAEPVADFLAAATTGAVFAIRFKGILAKAERPRPA